MAAPAAADAAAAAAVAALQVICLTRRLGRLGAPPRALPAWAREALPPPLRRLWPAFAAPRALFGGTARESAPPHMQVGVRAAAVTALLPRPRLLLSLATPTRNVYFACSSCRLWPPAAFCGRAAQLVVSIPGTHSLPALCQRPPSLSVARRTSHCTRQHGVQLVLPGTVSVPISASPASGHRRIPVITMVWCRQQRLRTSATASTAPSPPRAPPCRACPCATQPTAPARARRRPRWRRSRPPASRVSTPASCSRCCWARPRTRSRRIRCRRRR